MPGQGASSPAKAGDGRVSEYRYTLTRGPWLNGDGTVLFVMLNPSTADEHQDDPTIRRCVRFAQTWEFARLTVGNLYALHATDPRDLFRVDDPVGPRNDLALIELARGASEVIVAWGATQHPQPPRASHVLDLLEATFGPVRCLGLTPATGQPRHPLYTRADAERRDYVRTEVAAA